MTVVDGIRKEKIMLDIMTEEEQIILYMKTLLSMVRGKYGIKLLEELHLLIQDELQYAIEEKHGVGSCSEDTK